MPVSPEAMLISAVLRNGDYESALKSSVNAAMFHAYEDEWVWIERYFTKHRRTPSILAFRHEFGDFKVYRVDDTPHFVEKVRESHARYALTTVMRDCTELIAAGDIDKAVAFMTANMNKVSATMGATADISVIDDWQKTYDEAEYRKTRFDEFGMAGVPTGFATLDERTGGIQQGQMWILSARLGQKKSWSLQRMATAALMAGYNVHYTALEQTSVEVSMRVHNFLSGSVGKQVFQTQSLMTGNGVDLRAYNRFLRGLRTHIKSNMTLSDKRGIGISEFRAQLERHRPDVWYLDHMTLANTGGRGEWQDVAALSTKVNDLAGEYNIGIVSAAQINRGGTGTDAGPEHLAGSDKIGQDAAVVIITRELSPSVNLFKVGKARNGKGGFKWYCHFDPSQGIFDEVPKQRALDLVDLDKANAEDE